MTSLNNLFKLTISDRDGWWNKVEQSGREWNWIQRKDRLRSGESNRKRVQRRKEFIIYCTEGVRGIRPGRNERNC